MRSNENQIPTLKILKSLAKIKSHPNLYVNSIIFAINHNTSRIKQSAIDLLTSKFSLNEKNSEKQKIIFLFLQNILKFINDKSIFMRFDHWLPEEINSPAFETIAAAINEILNQTHKNPQLPFEVLEKIQQTERFNNFLYKNIAVSLGKYLYSFQSILNENNFTLISQIYGKNDFELM